MKKRFTFLIAAIAAILMMAQPMKALADHKTGSWDLTSTSSDWTASNCATYFSQPYGMKKANAYIVNANIADFSTTGTTSIKIGVKSLQNGGTTSVLTVYLVDKDGETVGSGQTITPVNASSASNTTYQYVTFTSGFTGVKGFKVQCTTFGKNILINGANYDVTYTATAYTVTLGDTNTQLTEDSAGAGVTLPSRSNVSPYTFAGWITDNITTETTTAPGTIIPVGTYYPTASITLYPVYTRTEGGGTTDVPVSVDISEYAEANGWGSSTSEGQKVINIDSYVTATASNGTNTGKYYNDGWRLYESENATVTIETTTGTLKSVAFTFTNSNNGTLNYNSSALTSGTAVNVSGTSAEFSVSRSSGNSYGQIRVTQIDVTYTITGTTYYISVVSTGTPSITASNVEIFYNATDGSIGYSITDEPETPGTLTAAIKAGTTSTITNLTIDNNNITNTEVPFTCGVNNELSAAHTATVTLTYAYGNNETVTKDVTITQTAHPTPSITAENVEINYNATGGNIAYTINDGFDVGSVSASVPNNSWVTLPNTFDSPIAFTCEDTEGIVARTETVTLTYTYNTNQTVTKEVTVTQGVDATLGTSANPYTVAQARTFIDGLNGATSADGKHVSGIISQVDSYSSQYKSITYWISDDGTTTDQLQVYSGKGINGADFSAETDVAVGAEVVVKGKLKYYSNQSVYEFDHSNELVSYTAPVVPNPTITIAAGLEENLMTDPENDAAAGTTVQIAVIPPTNFVLETLTVTKDNSETVDVSPAVSGLVTDYTFNMPASNVTISATFVDESTTTTILYSVNGVDDEVMLYTTTGYELPTLTSSQIPEGFDFAGWTLDETASPIELLDENYVPANDDILIAVFSREEGAIPGDFTLVTSEPSDWSGNYLIAYNDDTFADGRVGGTDGIGKQNTSVDPDDNLSNGEVSGTWGNTYCVTLEKYIENNETYYLLKTKDGKYNYRSSNSNGLDVTVNKSTAVNYPLSVTLVQDNSVYYVDISSSTGAVFHYNTSGYFRFYKDGGQSKVQLYKQGAGIPGTTKYYTRIIPSNPVVEDDINITGPTIIESGSTLDMGAHSIINNDPTKLIIEDGAQLILANNNINVKATVKKSITAAVVPNSKVGEAPFGWYSISSSVNNAIIAGEGANTNLITTTAAPYDFDLYRYNETKSAKQWENYHASNTEPFTNMTNGRGYLYRNANSVTIEFTGTVNTGDVEYTVTKTEVGALSGFNLIGNPYTHDIYKGTGGAIDDSKLNEGFYVATNSGSWTACTDNTTPIEKNQGILVQANDGGVITMTNTTNGYIDPNAKANHDNIKFMVSNSQYEDVAYAMFEKGNGLNKISHRNAEIPMLYIPQNDENYAIAMMSDDTQSFGLNFKAMTMGKYTLSYKANGQFSYLHVIDRLTGEDVDMLLEESYSFVGTPKDAENRFIVKLNYQSGLDSSDNSTFAYQSGNDIIVSGEGTLQIFDVMGRMIATQNINGVETVNVPANGVYVFRLNEKVQKVVVK